MNPEAKALWLTALRSGEYQQGTGRLHSRAEGGDQYCCLGVLCDVAVRNGLDVKVGECAFGSGVMYDGASSWLPGSVSNWAGLTSGNPMVTGFTLADWNDRQAKDFAFIADLVEEHL